MNSRNLFEMTNRFNLNKILTKQITDLEIGIPYQVLSIKSFNSGCLNPCLVQLCDTITDDFRIFELYLPRQYSVLPSYMRLNSVYMTYHGMGVSYKEEQYPHLTFNNITSATSTPKKKQEKNNFLGKRGHEKRLEFFNKNRFS